MNSQLNSFIYTLYQIMGLLKHYTGYNDKSSLHQTTHLGYIEFTASHPTAQQQPQQLLDDSTVEHRATVWCDKTVTIQEK